MLFLNDTLNFFEFNLKDLERLWEEFVGEDRERDSVKVHYSSKIIDEKPKRCMRG